MKFSIPFLAWTGRPPLEVDIPDGIGEHWRLRAALETVVKHGAGLMGANLAGAHLNSAHFAGACFAGACFDGASLIDVNLDSASLVGVSLIGAGLMSVSFVSANLIGANLSNVGLDHANLTGADLTDASLTGARLNHTHFDMEQLAQADLRSIEADLYHVLVSARDEAPGLLTALQLGKVDGSTYTGECACLVGTIANIRGVDPETLAPDAERPIERFFLAIREGDTPANNPVAKIAEGWILKFLGYDPVVAE